MKTLKENVQIRRICNNLMDLLQSAGFSHTWVWYDEKPEEIVVEGEIEKRVSVYASSTKAIIIDIFRQLLPAVEQVV